MMESLGARFFDANGELVGGTGDDVKRVAEADLGDLLKLTRGCRFRVACDVTNPLCGENGCSFVFGPQKGGTPDMLAEMDEAIGRFSRLIETQMGTENAADAPGAGAAGGLGFAFRTALGAELVSGHRPRPADDRARRKTSQTPISLSRERGGLTPRPRGVKRPRELPGS